MNTFFSIDMIALPLIFIPLVLFIKMLLSYQLYSNLKRKKDLYAIILQGVSAVLALNPLFWTGIPLAFWSSPFHWTTIAILLSMFTTAYVSAKLRTSELIVFVISLLLLISSFSAPATIAGTVTGLTLLLLGGFYLFEIRQQRFFDQSYPFSFIILALLSFIGHWIPYNGGRFLYGLALLMVITYSLFKYFEKIISMFRTASLNSLTDTLTGLYNKRYLQTKSAQLAESQEIEIIFIDIDNFKQLNDQKGHDVGDIVLKQVGALLKEIVAGEGIVCRFGGEEMVCIIHSGNGVELAGRICRQVEKKTEVTVSVGVAKGTGDAAKIIRESDENMYKAKNSGKNKVVSY